jgi:hypothetical protein
MNSRTLRILFDVALILSLFYVPWIIGAAILVAACFTVRRFYEAVVFGIAADALYATSFGFHAFPYMCSAFAAIVLIVSLLIRDRLAW